MAVHFSEKVLDLDLHATQCDKVAAPLSHSMKKGTDVSRCPKAAAG